MLTPFAESSAPAPCKKGPSQHCHIAEVAWREISEPTFLDATAELQLLRILKVP